MSPAPLPALQRLAPRLFYGWIIAIGSSLLAFVTVGIGFYCQVVFLHGLSAEHGWSKSSVSGATSLYFISVGLTGHWIGGSVDRAGPRRWILAGVGVMSAALLLLGRLEAPWQLYPVYALLAAGFAMAGTVPSSAIITRWFVARRARAMSFAQTGVSVGGMVLVPVVTGLIVGRGMAGATQILVALLLAIAVPVTIFVLRDDPRRYGLAPDGGAERAPAAPPARAPAQYREWSRREARATPAFRRTAAAFATMLFAQVAFAVHQLSFLCERLDPRAAALAVSTTAAGSIVARLAVGSFADRVNTRHLGVGLFAFQALMLVVFATATSPLVLFAASLGFGFTIGNIFMLQSLVVGELFGMTSYGRVYGMLQLITQMASGLGPVALGLLYERLGGYPVPVALLAALAGVAALLLSGVRPPPPRDDGS